MATVKGSGFDPANGGFQSIVIDGVSCPAQEVARILQGEPGDRQLLARLRKRHGIKPRSSLRNPPSLYRQIYDRLERASSVQL